MPSIYDKELLIKVISLHFKKINVRTLNITIIEDTLHLIPFSLNQGLGMKKGHILVPISHPIFSRFLEPKHLLLMENVLIFTLQLLLLLDQIMKNTILKLFMNPQNPGL